jgi:predicted phosphodiesterase
MRFVAISDTHGQHQALELPEGDVIVHAGDVSARGRRDEIVDFLSWYARTPFRHRVLIAGNHDFFFEDASADEVAALIPAEVIYLNDSGLTLEGVKIWGSPIQPWFHDWAFNRQRGAPIREHWDLIPSSLDLLITHGPAFGLLDRTVSLMNVGCEDLLEAIARTRPKVHLCGHIHEAYGQVERDGIVFINASVLDFRYRLRSAPIVFDLP